MSLLRELQPRLFDSDGVLLKPMEELRRVVRSDAPVGLIDVSALMRFELGERSFDRKRVYRWHEE